jgi:hypothetical protein
MVTSLIQRRRKILNSNTVGEIRATYDEPDELNEPFDLEQP